MKIKADITLTFDNMDKYSKEFHVALINEILRKASDNMHPLNIRIQEVRKNDVSYDMSNG